MVNLYTPKEQYRLHYRLLRANRRLQSLQESSFIATRECGCFECDPDQCNSWEAMEYYRQNIDLIWNEIKWIEDNIYTDDAAAHESYTAYRHQTYFQQAKHRLSRPGGKDRYELTKNRIGQYYALPKDRIQWDDIPF